MAHFAGTKFAVDLGRDVDLQNIGKLFGDFANRRAACRCQCSPAIRRACPFPQRANSRARCLPQMKNRASARRLRKAPAANCSANACKNRDHAGVRIKDRLARSVCAGVTQRDRGNTDLFSPEQHQPLLINFRQAVNGFATDRRVLRSRNARCDRAAKSGNAPANRLCAIVPPAAPLEKPIHVRDNRRRLRCKQLASSQRRLS